MMSQHRMPSTAAAASEKRDFRKPGSTSDLSSRTCRSMSLKMSSTMILQPSCSPKKLTLLPTTGPRSRRTGDSRDVKHVRNLRSALVANTGSSAGVTTAGTSGSVLRGEMRSSRPTKYRFYKFLRVLGSFPGSRILRFSGSQVLEPPNRVEPENLRTSNALVNRFSGSDSLAGGRGRRRRRCNGRRLRRRLALGRRGALALHVNAAPEVRPFRDGDARRDDVAINRTVVTDVNFVARGDIACHFAEDDYRFCKDLCLDAAVGTDRQHVVAQLNGSLDMTFDGQIFAAVQLALDDDRFSDVHNVFLHKMGDFGTRTGGHHRRLRWCWRRGRLSSRRTDCFITFPHVILRLSSSQEASRCLLALSGRKAPS